MRVTKLASTCENGDCPTLYATDRDTILIRGETPVDHGLALPAHETVVEIPVELLRKVLRDQRI
ncbi:hypothetical protein KBZ10_02860 [Streptomyces sp. F63]|uniref:hypothetical protein n=1 Tax=Streptomyces sp. F63 TaxID=2824887 RepID=UPI001B361DE2|nr:hypothetical protein [Streptomyces sp. F63]MBQ0983490.1 hypothetical protein [Streptomyces sp. F63]